MPDKVPVVPSTAPIADPPEQTGFGIEIEAILRLDRTVHEPSCLAVLTILWRVRTARCPLIRRLGGLSKGNLSNHLAKLDGAALVSIGKAFEGKTPVTTVKLTGNGEAAIEAYWSKMDAAAGSRRRAPEPDASYRPDPPPAS